MKPAALVRTIAVVLVAIAAAYWQYVGSTGSGAPDVAATAPLRDDAAIIARAFEAQTSDLWVQGHGVVERSLKDDREGSAHQRFILRLSNGHSLLIAHNIDLAPRVPLEVGDTIQFHGEFEWNPRGGVVHWTHHDPRGRRDGGWLRHAGQTYR